MKLHEDIMELLKKKATETHDYVNPHFLLGVTQLLEDYYEYEDDEVDRWVQDMFGA